MNKQKDIRTIVALLMLVLFAFSITPRKTLHDLFGCHQGKNTEVLAHPGDSLGTDSFHCSCDQPELQAPFIDYPVSTGITSPVSFQNQYRIPSCTPLCDSTTVFSKLRGPPPTA